MSRQNLWEAQDREYAAYAAQEMAKNPSIPLSTIFDSLGGYDQGVVDTRSSQKSNRINKRKRKNK
jgi:beta-lactamase class D